jgi:transcriptional regulator with XRE-family HTH domain
VTELVRRLIEIQDREGLSNTEFARLLGVHRAMWSLVRSNNRKPGKKLLEGAFRRWPELSYVYAQALQISTDPRANHEVPAEVA